MMGMRSLRARDLGSAPSGFANSRAGARGRAFERPCPDQCRYKRGPEGGWQAGRAAQHASGPCEPLPCPDQGRHLLGARGQAPRHDLGLVATWVWGLGGGMTLIKVPTLDLWGPCALTGSNPRTDPKDPPLPPVSLRVER